MRGSRLLVLGALLAATATIGTPAPAQAACGAQGFYVDGTTIERDPNSCIVGSGGAGNVCYGGYYNGSDYDWSGCVATRPGNDTCIGETCISGIPETVQWVRDRVGDIMDDVPTVEEVCTPSVMGSPPICITP